MAVGPAITQGFGIFGSTALVITLGYGSLAALPITANEAQSTHLVASRRAYKVLRRTGS